MFTNKEKKIGENLWVPGLGKEFFHMTRKNITPKGKERTENWTSSRGNKGPSKNTCTPVLTEAPFTIAKTREQAKCPSTEEWIKKNWYTDIMEYYSAIKRKERMTFAATWMDLEITMLSEVSYTVRHQCHMLSLKCGI